MEWRERIGIDPSRHDRHVASTDEKTNTTVRGSTALTSLRLGSVPQTGRFMTWYV